jgi:DNA invertase Pin-like site-specific DNA recombinase
MRPPARQRKQKQRRAVLYVRVSTRDKQHPANQTRPLREWCDENAVRIVTEYIDHESGAKDDRPQFIKMMEAAARHEFDIVVCWSLDRFTREGIAPTFQYLKRLRENRVDFYSYTEEFFRTIGPAADLLIAVTAWIAEYERRRRSERVAAGMARAKADGKRIGRTATKFTDAQIAQMKSMHDAGVSLRAIALKFETSKATVERRIA